MTSQLLKEIEKIEALLKSGMFEEARTALERAVNTYPASVDLHYLYAGVLFQLGNIQEAEDSLRTIIQEWPTFKHAYSSLGTLYWTRGDAEKALECFQKILEIDPNFDSAHVNTALGLIAYEQGDMEKAERFITTAIFTDILSVDAYKKLIPINKLKTHKQYKFSMIIPTYNRYAELKRCIRSLRENSVFPVEIIVISDPCSDGTIEYLEKEKSKGDLISIINETRIGMPKSANRGFRTATGDYVGYINDDAEVMPGWDLSIVVTIDNDLTAGCAAPLVIFPDGRVQSPGQYNPYKSIIYGFIGKTLFIDSTCVVGKYIKDFPVFHIPRECDYGYFPVMKRACIDKAGFFDEQYEHYFIDPDLGYKIQKAGYKNIYCPTSVFVHHELSKKDPVVLQKRFTADLPKFFNKWGLYEYYYYK